MTEERIRRARRVVFRRLEPGAGGVLLDLDSGQYRQLNEIGALIWEALEADPSRTQLLAELRRVIKGPPAGMDSEVATFLESLRKRGLIEIGSEPD